MKLFLKHKTRETIVNIKPLNVSFAFFTEYKPGNAFTTNQRLNNKAQNVGSNTDQIQNYERHILMRKNHDVDIDVAKDIDVMFDHIESTNHTYINPRESSNELNFNEYLEQSNKYLALLKSAFINLMEFDNKIRIEIDRMNLYLKIYVETVGVYIINKELESKMISVTSPISGLFKYKFDCSTNYWRSPKDKHIVDELLIREFCNHSKGLLIINNN